MLKLLIVDDEPLILQGLSHILNWNELGLELAGTCGSGMQAWKLLQQTPIDIVITDIKMPEMHGIDLIRRIKQERLNTRCIVLSSYDDFQYVKEAALLGIENYLLKPVSTTELIATLNNVIEKIESDIFRQIEQKQEKHILRNNVVYRWLTNDIDRKELDSRASLLEISLESEAYVAAMIKLAYDEKKAHTYRIPDKKLLRFAACNICEELAFQQAAAITITDMNGDLAVLFSQDGGEPSGAAMRSILQACVTQLNSLLGIDVFVTVGDAQPSCRQVHASYAQAKSMQSFQLLYSYNSIIFYDEVAPFLSSEATLPNLNPQRLRKALSSRDISAAQHYYAEVSACLRDKRHFSPSHVQHAVMEIVFHITAVMHELSPQPEPFFESNRSLFQQLHRLDTMESMMKSLEEITATAIAYLHGQDERISPFIRRVIGYVQRNYAHNIDLKQVALEYKVNSMYLGQLFRKETGETFTSYINHLRIDKAKHLLRTTHLKTNDIASQVGYVNANYFPTIFKKIVGKSPSDYQREAVGLER